MECSPARLLCPWDFPGKNTGVGCHFLLQGIFLTWGSNLVLLHWQEDSFITVPLGNLLLLDGSRGLIHNKAHFSQVSPFVRQVSLGFLTQIQQDNQSTPLNISLRLSLALRNYLFTTFLKLSNVHKVRIIQWPHKVLPHLLQLSTDSSPLPSFPLHGILEQIPDFVCFDMHV